MASLSVKTINGLARGLEVRRLLSEGSGTGLADLHRTTGIPKASLLRILATLERCGEARRIGGNGEWIASAVGATPVDGSATSQSLLACLDEALADLGRVLPWPSDAAIRHGPRMRVVASNRALFGKTWRRGVIGQEVDMIRSAMGRTWLAFTGTRERDALLKQLIPTGASFQARRSAALPELAAVRERGYGLRDPLYAGPDADEDAQLSAFAVPVLGDDGVLACISCVWNTGVADTPRVVQTCLVPLIRGAARIEYRHSAG